MKNIIITHSGNSSGDAFQLYHLLVLNPMVIYPVSQDPKFALKIGDDYAYLEGIVRFIDDVTKSSGAE